MNQLILITGILITINLFPACEQKSYDYNIEGVWYSCTSDKGYYEYYFFENYVEVKMELNSGIYSYVRGYDLSSDTIYLYQDNPKNNDGFILINSFKDNVFNISTYEKNGTVLENNIKIIKMNEDILSPEKTIEEQNKKNNEFEFEKTFYERKKKNKCSFSPQENNNEGELKFDEY